MFMLYHKKKNHYPWDQNKTDTELSLRLKKDLNKIFSDSEYR